MPDIRVTDEIRPGRGGDNDLLLRLPDRVSVRELIRTRVREEVARANADRSAPRRLLVAPVDAEDTLNGYRIREGRRIDWEQQAEIALGAFQQQAFFVFVDGRQADSLDEELALGADSEIRFLRVTPLVGG